MKILFFDNSFEIIERINDIPKSNRHHFPVKEPKVLCIEEFDPGNADAPCYPELGKCFVYKLSGYECGASLIISIVQFCAKFPYTIKVFENLIG